MGRKSDKEEGELNEVTPLKMKLREKKKIDIITDEEMILVKNRNKKIFV